MALLKPREERKTIFVRARLRSDQGWSDVTIANVSSRGLMLQSAAGLRRNDFVEVRYRHVCIVGRIVWAGGARCGVRTQDRIDIAELLSQAPVKRRRQGEERRVSVRTIEGSRQPRAAADTAEASSRTARLFDWAIVGIGGGAAAAMVAQFAYSALDAPLGRVSLALAGG